MRHAQLKFQLLFIALILGCFVNAKSIEPQSGTTTTLPGKDSPDINQPKQQFVKRIRNASDSITKISAYYNYGMFLDEQMEFDQAVVQLNNALRIANTVPDYKMATKISNHLGGMYWSAGDCEISTNYFEQALKSAELSNSNDLIAMVKMNLSGNYNSAGDANKAIEYSLAALDIKEKNNKLEGICFDYVTVGEIFQNIGNVDKWKLYIKKAYDLKDTETCAKMTDLVMIYNNLGTIAEAEKEYNKALAYYDTMMIVSKTNDYYEGIGISRLNSALIYQLLGKPAKALELTNESMQYLGEVPYFIMAVNNVKAELLQELDRNTEALELAALTLKNEELDYYPGLKQQCLTLLYSLNFKIGNYQQAFNWNDTLKVYENALREQESLKVVEELETKYETEKKQQQIELLTTENKLRKRIMQAGIVIVVILVLLVILIFYTLQIRKKQAEFIQNNLQQKVLRAQMNPHFIFNVLGSIQNFMLQNDTRKASSFLSQFALLTRATLNNSAAETIALSDEIEMLKNYIELEKMRKGDKFDYEIQFDENMETDFIQIPPMLIQPFVENAIKHGFKSIENMGLLNLSFYDEGKILKIEITDNGVGIKKAAQLKSNGHSSKAMQIFEERRKLFAKKTKQLIAFSITDRSNYNLNEQGTKVQLLIPININY